MESFPYEEKVGPKDDVIIIYSDGITEAMNAADELRRAARGSAPEGERTVGDRDQPSSPPRAHAGKHPQSDDMTIVVVKRTGP